MEASKRWSLVLSVSLVKAKSLKRGDEGLIPATARPLGRWRRGLACDVILAQIYLDHGVELFADRLRHRVSGFLLRPAAVE